MTRTLTAWEPATAGTLMVISFSELLLELPSLLELEPLELLRPLDDPPEAELERAEPEVPELPLPEVDEPELFDPEVPDEPDVPELEGSRLLELFNPLPRSWLPADCACPAMMSAAVMSAKTSVGS